MTIQIRDGLKDQYTDIYTPEALAALEALSGFNKKQKALMAKKIPKKKMKGITIKKELLFLIPLTQFRAQT